MTTYNFNILPFVYTANDFGRIVRFASVLDRKDEAKKYEDELQTLLPCVIDRLIKLRCTGIAMLLLKQKNSECSLTSLETQKDMSLLEEISGIFQELLDNVNNTINNPYVKLELVFKLSGLVMDLTDFNMMLNLKSFTPERIAYESEYNKKIWNQYKHIFVAASR